MGLAATRVQMVGLVWSHATRLQAHQKGAFQKNISYFNFGGGGRICPASCFFEPCILSADVRVVRLCVFVHTPAAQ